MKRKKQACSSIPLVSFGNPAWNKSQGYHQQQTRNHMIADSRIKAAIKRVKAAKRASGYVTTVFAAVVALPLSFAAQRHGRSVNGMRCIIETASDASSR